MTKQLKGKIYWVEDDFKHAGTRLRDETAHVVAMLDNVIVDEHMIKFFVCPFEDAKRVLWSYNVNLLINDSATQFNGTFTEDTDGDYNGKIYAELFSNRHKYMIYGRWIENEVTYTFWAMVDKE